MRIRNNNDFIFLLAFILGVLVAFYSCSYLGGYVHESLELQPYLQAASVGELLPVLILRHQTFEPAPLGPRL